MSLNVPKGTRADMHTHSENSYDSQCKLEDMCLAQIERGTSIMAVTDHLNALEYSAEDSFESFCEVHRNVPELNKKYEGRCRILSGIEIGEGYANVGVYKKIMSLIDFDVVIGSVHKLRRDGAFVSCTKTDFSQFTEDELYEAIDSYLDDVILMVESMDIDILAHLAYPLRYIVWQHGRTVDITRFTDKIKTIYRIIIDKNIALEINTAFFGLMDELNPPAEFLKIYRSLGGKLITLGSDAHNVEAASCYFGEVIEILKTLGFENIYYYEKRILHEIEI